MLAFHVIPDIENAYLMKIGMLENDAFKENLKLLRINRKIELYKERLKLKREIDEEEIEKQFKVPVLASIPVYSLDFDKGGKRK